MEEASTQKARTRARILDEAARAMRECGPDGIGIAALMKRAGLTHGGFYAHFENRDDLVAHAVDRMFTDSGRLAGHHLRSKDARDGLKDFIDFYLSDALRRSADQSCPLPSLSGNATRMPPAARQRFCEGIANFRLRLEQSLEAAGFSEPASLASSMLSEMVGAMSLARALDDDAAASATLRTSREQLKRRLGF